MRELLRKYIIIMFAVGCAIMIFVNIELDFNIAKKQQEAIFQSIMHQIVDIIDNNEAEALSFKLELEQEYIIRARALASILATIENPVIYQTKELVKLAAFLDIDEINIFNEEGYIVASTENEYIGYSINKTKQSQEFLPLLHSINKNEKYVQDVQSNMYGKYMKYIGVNSLGYHKGFIQIGLSPERFSHYEKKIL